MKEWNILFIDDEKHILNSIIRLLRKEGYNIYIADNGNDALELLNKVNMHIVISDQRMPGIKGNELLLKVKKLYPETIRMILSGYADMNVIIESINSGCISRFIPKPWDEEELKIIIRQGLQEYAIQSEIDTFTKQINEQNGELKKINAALLAATKGISIKLDLFQCACQNLPIAILGITQDNFIVYQNKFAESFFAKQGRTIIGENTQKIFNNVFLNEINKLVIDQKSKTYFKDTLYNLNVNFYLDSFHLKENQFGIIVVFDEV